MTETTPVAGAPAVPPFWQELARALAQKGLSALATMLTGYGIIAPSQEAQLISLGLSAVAWAVSFGWTYAHEHRTQAKLVAAINAPAAQVAQ